MALNFAGTGGMFAHNEQFSEGIAQRGVRAGQATVIVSIDGAGDSEAIHEAIKLLPDNGGVIYIKEGTYVVESEIKINKPNVSIIGAGRSTKLVTTSNIRMMTVEEVNNCVIQGIRFRGTNNAAHSTQSAITLKSTTNSSVLNNWIEYCYGGIVLTGVAPSNNIIRGNIIRDGSDRGIISFGHKNIIIANIIKNIDDKGIECRLANNNIISNNYVDNSTDLGIKIGSSHQTVIVGNQIHNGSDWGIEITAASDRTLVSGNTILNNTLGAVRDLGTNTHPNGASGTNNLAVDDLNIIA